jgi:hypothetical protein
MLVNVSTTVARRTRSRVRVVVVDNGYVVRKFDQHAEHITEIGFRYRKVGGKHTGQRNGAASIISYAKISSDSEASAIATYTDTDMFLVLRFNLTTEQVESRDLQRPETRPPLRPSGL